MKNILYLLFPAIFLSEVPAQWVRIDEVPQFSNVPSFFVNGDTIYAGADSVVYISNDAGISWNASSEIHPDADFVSALIYVNKILFAGTYNHGVFKSTNNGISWQEVNMGLNDRAAKTIGDFVLRNGKLYAGTFGAGVFVYDLENQGPWLEFNNGLSFNNSYTINSLLIKDDILYAGAGANGYYFTNSSYSEGWTEHQFGIVNSEPLIFYDMTKTVSGDYIASSYGIYKSTDNGSSWSPHDLSNGYLWTGNFVDAGGQFLLALTRPNKTIWYELNSDGNSWNIFNEVPGTNTLNAAYLNGRIFDGRLYGLYYYPLNISGIEEPLSGNRDLFLSSNYPNPFNPSTRINFSLKNAGKVKLVVFNSMGEEISILIDEEKNAGSYSVEFNAANLPSGIYFCRMEASGNMMMRKMLLLK